VRFHQVQRDVRTPAVQQVPVTDELWQHHEPDLVQQAVFEQSLPEPPVPVHDEILTFLFLEIGHGRERVTADDGRVVPGSVHKGGREHVLPHRVHPVRVWVGAVRPQVSEDLVGTPPHQHRVADQKMLQRLPRGRVVEVLTRPQVRRADHAIQGQQG
jgi:hypothetical protein